MPRLEGGIYQWWGPPGSGKTTRLASLVDECLRNDQQVLITSLTKTAAQEVRQRQLMLPPEAIGTLHAHCYHGLGRPEIITSKEYPVWNAQYPHWAMSGELSDDADDLLNEPTGDLTGDQLRSTVDIMRAQCLPSEHWPEYMREFARAWTDYKQQMHVYDFTDLLEMARDELPAAPGRPDVIFADESQDLSRLELQVLKQWGEQAQTLVLFGDTWQNVFSWRGTEANIFLEIPAPAHHRFLLTQSYRLPRAVHAQAMGWMRREYHAFDEKIATEFRPRTAEGEVYRYSFDPWQPEQAVAQIAAQLQRVNDQDQPMTVMWLTTCGYMLKPALEAFRAAGIPYHNPYRVKKGDWNPLRGQAKDALLAFTRPDRSIWGEQRRWWTVAEVQQWSKLLQAQGVIVRGQKKAIEGIEQPELLQRRVSVQELDTWFTHEHIGPITEVNLDWYLAHTLPKYKGRLAYPLAILRARGPQALQETPRLTVGTVHSVKGAESDVVWVSPQLSHAGMTAWMEDRASRESICRTLYVGQTRARQALWLGNGTRRSVVW
jgi:superfamily I DNA/RNA helicase